MQARQVDRETDFLLQLQSENSFIKGIVGWTDLEADELAIDQYLTYLDQVLEQFTPQRLMFGSDWPVCTLTATFDEVCDIMNLYIGKLSAHEQYLIMGESAALFYNIERV
ncbi:MAG: amidohydrolase family protein [bacterium]